VIFLKIYKDPVALRKYCNKFQLDKIIDVGLNENYEFHLFEKGDFICKIDEPVYYFYFLLDGKTKNFIMSDNGKILLIGFYEAFTNFGDIEIPNNTTYTSNVEAVTKCVLLALPVSFIKLVCLNRKSFLKYLTMELSKKLNDSSRKSSFNILYPLKNRLASFLIEHITVPNQRVINLTSSYKEIAESLGTTYRHLSRTLNEFKNSDIIEIKDKQIIILNEDELRNMSKDM
jgi:CRP-like cAMP-binding protein